MSFKQDDLWDDFGSMVGYLRQKVFDKCDIQAVNQLKENVAKSKSNKERIEACLQNEPLMSAFQVHFDQIKDKLPCHSKDDQIADSMIRDGQQLMNMESYADCLETFSAAIACSTSTTDNGPNRLAANYFQRAKVHYKIKNFDACLDDLKRAEQYGFEPKADWSELEQKCKTDKETELQEKPKAKVKSTKQETCQKDDFVPNNCQIYCGNDKIELKVDSIKGRTVNARHEMQFGDRILVEKPYAYMLDYEFYLAFCSNCAKQLKGNGIPCLQCDHALYCSQECLDQARQEYHTFECGRAMRLYEYLGLAYLPIRILAKIGLNTVLSMDWHQVEIENQINADSSVRPITNEYSSLLSLMTHHQDMDVDTHLNYLLAAILMKKYLIDLNLIDWTQSADNEFKLISMFVYHLQQLHCNSVGIVNPVMLDQVNLSDMCAAESLQIGVGLYAGLSMFNHSCKPNVLSMFEGNQVTISVSRKVSPGTELSFCYGPSVVSMSYKDRQQQLRKQYFFDCTCEGCANRLENRSKAYACHECNGPVIMNLDSSNKCLNCGLTDQQYDMKVIEQHESLLKSALESIKKQDYREACARAASAYNELCDHLHRHNGALIKCLETMNECYVKMGLYEYAVRFGAVALKLLSEIHGPDSVEAMNEKLKLLTYTFYQVQELILTDESKAKEKYVRLQQEVDELLHKFQQLESQVRDRLDNKYEQKCLFDEIDILTQLKGQLNQITFDQ